MSDVDLPVRARTYREPDGLHVAVVRGAELEPGLEHASQRADCVGVAVIEPPPSDPDLKALRDRRVLVVGSDGALVRNFVANALQVTEQVEWAQGAALPVQRIAEWALPVAGLVLAAGAGVRMGANKLLLELAGEPLVAHAVEAAGEGGCERVLAVYSDESVAAALQGRVTLVHNPDAATGARRAEPGPAPAFLVALAACTVAVAARLRARRRSSER